MLLRLLSASTLLLLPVVAVSPPLSQGNRSLEVCKTICVDHANNCVKEYSSCSPDPKCAGETAFAPSQCQNYYNMKIIPKRNVAPRGPVNPGSDALQPNPNLPQMGADPPCATICLEYMEDCRKTNGACFPDPKCTGDTDSGTSVPPPCPGTEDPNMEGSNANGIKEEGGHEDCPEEAPTPEDEEDRKSVV